MFLSVLHLGSKKVKKNKNKTDKKHKKINHFEQNVAAKN
jgi:hypothetical protein